MIRFYHFPSNPPSLNWDEVSFGYNAYSILKTGRDEYGKAYPMSFRSLDDYKLPVYMYSVVLSEVLFGLNDFAVRFPSAVSGFLTVFIVYFLVKELLNYSNEKKENIDSKFSNLFITFIPLFSAGFLFIMPWHVQFSRMAAEANMGLLFFTSAIYTFIRATKNKPWLFIISFLLFGFSMYSYLSFRVISVISLGILLIYYWKDIFRKKTTNYIALVFLSILFFILIRDSFAQGGHIRFSATSVFSQSGPYKQAQDEMFVDASKHINIVRRVFHDSPVFTSFLLISRGYLSHFSTDFLLFDQGQKHHHAPLVGLLYIWMVPVFFIGLYFSYSRMKRLFWFMLVWLLISPIPASVTFDIPHAIRSEGMVIPFAVFSATGIVVLIHGFRKLKKLWFIITCIFMSLIILFFAFHFFHQYDVHLPVERSDQWVFGRNDMTKYILAHEREYDRIIVSTKLEWSYIFLLYYSKQDPIEYLKHGGTKSGGWGEEGNVLRKTEFHRFDFANDKHSNDHILFVGTPSEFPTSETPIFIVRLLDQRPWIYFMSN